MTSGTNMMGSWAREMMLAMMAGTKHRLINLDLINQDTTSVQVRKNFLRSSARMALPMVRTHRTARTHTTIAKTRLAVAIGLAPTSQERSTERWPRIKIK